MPRPRRSERLPKVPTNHLPGSPGKIAVMQKRRRRGECLFHPFDAIDADDRGLWPWKSRNGKTHGAMAELFLRGAA